MEIEAVLKKMTPEQKLTFLTGADNWHTAGFKDPEVPQVTMSDGPHGVRKVRPGKDGKEETVPAVCFPTASAVAATWNPDLAYRMGRALAGECIERGVDILLGPGVCMKRSPLCGRNFEYFSEDPFLAGAMGAAYVNGLQSRGVGACVKHFAANDQETDRLFSSSEMDERTLREIYLKAFETVVREAKPWSVMCAYNRLNGVHCSQNPVLLDEILRGDWGFGGVVISDWGAVHDRPASLRASLELEMPYSEKSLPALKKAYGKGEITDAQIDRAVRSLLGLVQKARESAPLRAGAADTEEDRLALARETAAEAVTLLKNEDDILPVDLKETRRIAVIGGCAEKPFIQGGGSACVNPVRTDSPLEELKKIAGDRIRYSPAYNYGWYGIRPEIADVGAALDTAADADAVFLFAGENGATETEGTDRTSIRLHPDLENLILQVAQVNPRTVVILQAGSAIDMTPWIDAVAGVVFAWYGGSCGAGALADVLFGRVCPSGKLSETFPLSIEDTPAYGNYPSAPVAKYDEGVLTGYRYYDTVGEDVLFPFGYGLSYTTFEYSDLRVSSGRLEKGRPLTVTLRVKNTGNVRGKETVQLYVRDPSATVLRPEKELKGFRKVELEPGAAQDVSIPLRWEDFAFYSPVYRKWTVEEGAFRILVGASSRDIRLDADVRY